jgi:hypothetical protein
MGISEREREYRERERAERSARERMDRLFAPYPPEQAEEPVHRGDVWWFWPVTLFTLAGIVWVLDALNIGMEVFLVLLVIFAWAGIKSRVGWAIWEYDFGRRHLRRRTRR